MLELQCWCSNVGAQMLVIKRFELRCWCLSIGIPQLGIKFWYSDVGAQVLVLQCWYSNAGTQMMVVKCWYPNAGTQMMVLKCWCSNDGRHMFVMKLDWATKTNPFETKNVLQAVGAIISNEMHDPQVVKRHISEAEVAAAQMRSFLKTLSSLRRGNEKARLELLPKPTKLVKSSASDSDKDSHATTELTSPTKILGSATQRPLDRYLTDKNGTPQKLSDNSNKDNNTSNVTNPTCKVEKTEAGQATA